MGLQAAGHQVRLTAHVEFEKFVTERGLDFAVMPGNAAKRWRAGSESNPTEDSKENGRKGSFWDTLEEYSEKWLVASLEACRDAEAIIYTPLCHVGYHVAEKLRTLSFAVHFEPSIMTREFPSVYLPFTWSLGGLYNRLTHFVDKQTFWQPMRKRINRLRREKLGLPPLPFLGPYSRMYRARMPVLCAYSPTLAPRPSDWGDWVHVTGYWFLSRLPDWQPPADLVEFLESGPPPVYFDLGSFTHEVQKKAVKRVLSVLTLAGQRVITSPGNIDLSSDLTENTFCMDATTPHEWIFPRVSAVVAHGGMGTVHSALRAGVPTMAIPLFSAQHFWGRRLYELGAGPPPIPIRKASEKVLEEAVRVLVSDRTMRLRAAELGRLIQSEDGVARAVEAIERHFRG